MSKPDLVIHRHTFQWGSRTYIMGVINVTPDSFSDGGEYLKLENTLRHAEALLAAGADILDIGGESTRPFSKPSSSEEELARVIPAVREIRKLTEKPISVDTTKSEVARSALEEGADIINDISALGKDRKMAEVAAHYQAPVILMHMKGTPRDMQINPWYVDVVAEVKAFLKERIEWAKGHGISEERLIVDPGIGFGKSFQHNLILLNRLNELSELDAPILVGPSRKGFLGAITGIEKAAERDLATLGAVAVAAMRGADMVRVHNVSMAGQVLRVVNAICEEAAQPV